MKAFLEKALNAGRKFTILDFAFFKLSLLSFGIICGAYFAQFFLRNLIPLWIIFIVAYVWIMYRTFGKHMD